MMEGYELSKVRRSWLSSDNDEEMACYQSITGRITLVDLIAHMATVAPRAEWDEITLNFATIKWVASATDEERQKRMDQREGQRQRHEEWERTTYNRLREKFEGQQ